MKTTFLILLMMFGLSSFAQTSEMATYSNNLQLYSPPESKKWPDTVKCLFHEYSEDIVLDKWTSGYIVLKSGYITTGRISWQPDYAPMALGFFQNTFLYDDKHIVKNKVIQVCLY